MVTPFVKLEKKTQATSVTRATIQFWTLPKFSDPEPPAM